MNNQSQRRPFVPVSDELVFNLREEVGGLKDAVSAWQDTCIQLQNHVQHLLDKDKTREREIKALSAIILKDAEMGLILKHAPHLKAVLSSTQE